MSPFPPGFNGIDPALMHGMIKEFQRGRADITGAIGAHSNRLTALGVGNGPLREIDRVCRWIDEQLPMLIKRRDLAISLDDSSEPGMAQVPEALMLPPGEARRRGADLARQFRDTKPATGAYHDILNELAKHKFDSDYAAAFFTGLGPEMTRRLPALIEQYGKQGEAVRQLQDTSDALGSAVSGGTDVPGFGNVTQAMFDKNLSPDDREGLAALVSHGRFPPEWLASLARLHSLDPMFQRNTDQPPSAWADINNADWMTLRSMLQALSNNPAAARLAFQGLAEEKTVKSDYSMFNPILGKPDLSRVLISFTQLSVHDEQTAVQLGRAYAAGAGAYDEKGTAHSEDGARFAFAIMTSMPKVERIMPGPMRNAMSQIAGAYAPEIAEGANIDDLNQETVFRRVTTHTPGLSPVFSLSPEDTYSFLKTFADSPENMKPFEQGMGALTRRLVAEGIRLETARQRGVINSDAPGLERIMQALGYVAGLQSQAEKTVQGDLDERDATRRDQLRRLADAGFDMANIFAPMTPMLDENLWQFVVKFGGVQLDQLKDASGEKTRLTRLQDKELHMSLALQHSMVQRLIDNGYKVKVTPRGFTNGDYGLKAPYHDAEFTNEKGDLLPFIQIKKDPRVLANYIAWLEANGRGGDSERAFGQLAVNASAAFAGMQSQAGSAAADWERSNAAD